MSNIISSSSYKSLKSFNPENITQTPCNSDEQLNFDPKEITLRNRLFVFFIYFSIQLLAMFLVMAVIEEQSKGESYEIMFRLLDIPEHRATYAHVVDIIALIGTFGISIGAGICIIAYLYRRPEFSDNCKTSNINLESLECDKSSI